MNIFLGDEITLTKADTWVTGKVNGIKLDKGHLQYLAFEDLPVWFSLNEGWRIVNDEEEIDLDD